MAGPLNPNVGDPIYPVVPDIIPPKDPITSEDLGSIPNQFEGRIGYLEGQADEALRANLGDNYIEDPFVIPLHKLPSDVRATFTNEIDELTGMKRLISQNQGPTMFRGYVRHSPTGVPELERSPAGRFVFNPSEFTEGTVDPRILRMSQQTTRYDHARSIAMTERYYSAGTHYRQKVLNNLQQQIDNNINTDVMENGVSRAGRVLVFDVETPGLKPEEGIWQISARMLNDDGTHTDLTRSFNNPRMRWGGEVGQTRQSLQDFLNPEGVSDYESGMREFLEMANQADYIAGHNVLFDYRALHHGLTNTPAYRKDESFRTLADTFMGKFYNPDTKEMGNIIDTSQLSRALLHNIPLAQELEDSHSPYQFSMQNILLQTNLLSRVKEDIGQEEVSKLLSKGTHFADVDVPFESYLLKYLQEGAQGGTGLTQYAAGAYTGMTPEERSLIVGSRALTPNLPLTSIKHLNPLVAEKARIAGLLEEGNTNISPLENMIIASRDLTMESVDSFGEASKAKGFLNRFKLGGGVSEDVLDVANHAGIWNRLFKDKLTKNGTIRRDADIPTPQEWEKVQRDLQSAHIPLPGLSWVERHLSSVIGTAGIGLDQGETNLRKVFGQDVAPLGRFFGSENVGVVGRSQITKVPMSILEEWEQSRLDAGEAVSTAFTNPGERSQFLHGSFFNIGDHSEMSLVAQIDEDEKENLLNFLKQHPSVVDNDELIGKLERSFSENSGKYGIQVGTLTNLRGGMGVENVRSAFEQVMGIGADYSDQTPTIKLPYVGRNILEETKGENSLYTMGALVNTDVLNAEEKEVVARSTSTAIERYRQLATIKNTPMMGLLTRQAEEGLSDLGPARRIVQGYGKLREYSPLLGIAAGVGAVGYYRHEKHKKDRQLSEVMTLQPTSRNPRQNYGLVQQLNNNKIGHTNMGADKYSYLFGTGYS